jgi:hypothetical protein
MNALACKRSGLRNPLLRLGLGLGLTILSLASMARAQAPAPGGTALAGQNSAVPSRITQPIDETNRVTRRGNTHPLARPQFDQGAVADSQPIRRMLLLLQRSPGQETALRSLLDQQQSKSSANYHQWLTPQQFGQQFGPSDADVQAVTGWLQSHGFQVAGVSASRTVIEFSGNAGQVRAAFSTEIHRFVVNGVEHLANASDPQIPAALAPVVAGPVSLHNFPLKAYNHSRGVFSRSKETGQVKPLLTVSSGGSTFFALGPADFAKIYNVPVGANNVPNGGSGQTIAIVGDSEICTKNSPDYSSCTSDDVVAFREFFGLPVNSPACPGLSGGPVCVIVDGPDPGLNPPGVGSGDEIEGDLDVEWSGAIAPNAQIDFVIAEDTEATAGTDLAAVYVVDNNLASEVSESFGACEAYLGLDVNEFESAVWEQAAAQGITAIVSAGDAGSAGCEDSDASAPNAAVNGNQVNGIASTPFNVAAGGTDFDIDLPSVSTYASTYWSTTNNTTTGESAKSYIPEIPWNDSCSQSLSVPPSATGCSPPAASDTVITVGGGGGQSNCLNSTVNSAGLVTACGSAAGETGSNLPGYPKPSWQSGSYVTGTASTDGSRDVPDISLFAAAGFKSNSFYAICESDLMASCLAPDFEFLGIGGTSSSAPSFAGIMALVNQNQGANARQGNANYVLYALASKQASTPPSGGCNSTSNPNTASCTFYDVTLGNNSVPCRIGSLDCVSDGTDYGVVENPSGTIAFNAGTGYDLATGLGTINVTNLINNWSSVAGSFTGTTTTLCLIVGQPPCASPPAAVTITHGAQVNGQITVTAAGSPIPVSNNSMQSEIVSLIGSGGNLPSTAAGVSVFTASSDAFDSNNYVVSSSDAFPLTSGASSFSTRYLVGGASYSAEAHYPGDGTYGASNSTPITVTVNAEPSRTTVTGELVNFISETIANLPGESVYYGDALILRADVVGVSSGQENGTGSVTFKDGATTLGTFALNTEGYTEDQTGSNIDGVTTVAALPVGSHSVTVTYTGDNSYCPSSSTTGTCAGTSVVGPVNFTVVMAPTTTTMTPSGSTVVASGASVTLSVLVDTLSSSTSSSGGSSGANLTGTVTFTAAAQSAVARPVGTPSSPNWLVASLAAALAIFSLSLVRFQLQRRWGLALLTMLLAATVGTSVSCGSHTGSGSEGGTGATTLGSMAPTATTDTDGFVAGKASITIRPTASEIVTATYSGDGNYGTSASTSLSITVQ